MCKIINNKKMPSCIKKAAKNIYCSLWTNLNAKRANKTPISKEMVAGMVATFATPERLAIKSIDPRIIREKPMKNERRLAIFCIGLVFIISHYSHSALTLPMGIAYDSIKNP